MMNSTLFLHIEFWGFYFRSPYWLLLLILVPIFLYIHFLSVQNEEGVFKFSRPSTIFKSLEFQGIKWIFAGIYLSLFVGATFLVLSFAKPYKIGSESEENYEEGIDIMIAMDVSGSMMATDFLPNRLEAAKEVAKEFIDGRKTDRIGFVAFEGEAFTACPATRNYDYLKKTIDDISSGLMEPGTAIGTGLGTAVARLNGDSLTTKVVILLTDGVNNSGSIQPMEAAELAKKKGVTVYTIGVGKKGIVEMPIETPFGKIKQQTRVDIDEDLMEAMSKLTGGEYFRATDEKSLRKIYRTIDEMETDKILDKNIQKEPPVQPGKFLLIAFIFISIGMVGEQIVMRKNV